MSCTTLKVQQTSKAVCRSSSCRDRAFNSALSHIETWILYFYITPLRLKASKSCGSWWEFGPHLCELLLRQRLDQLVVKLKNCLEVVENILTGHCEKNMNNGVIIHETTIFHQISLQVRLFTHSHIQDLALTTLYSEDVLQKITTDVEMLPKKCC